MKIEQDEKMENPTEEDMLLELTVCSLKEFLSI